MAFEKPVSYIMPCFNTKAEYLKEAVASVLEQNYSNIELILVDDGSAEKSWETVQEIAGKDSRIVLFRNSSNLGVAQSLNVALSKASGAYILRMDSDDVCSIDRTRVTVDYMETHPDVDIVGSQYCAMKGRGVLSRKSNLPESDSCIKARLLWASPFAHPTVCFRSSSVDKYGIRYQTGEKTEDYNLWVDCAIKGCRFANIHKPLLKYRIHGNQITSKYASEIQDSGARIRKRLFDYLAIRLSDNEMRLFNSFRDRSAIEGKTLSDVDEVLVKVINMVPSCFSQRKDLEYIIGNKFYRECMRAAFSGNKEVSKIYFRSTMADSLKLKMFRTLCLRCISLIK